MRTTPKKKMKKAQMMKNGNVLIAEVQKLQLVSVAEQRAVKVVMIEIVIAILCYGSEMQNIINQKIINHMRSK